MTVLTFTYSSFFVAYYLQAQADILFYSEYSLLHLFSFKSATISEVEIFQHNRSLALSPKHFSISADIPLDPSALF